MVWEGVGFDFLLAVGSGFDFGRGSDINEAGIAVEVFCFGEGLA